MTFFIIVGWIMLFMGICSLLLIPGVMVALILVVICSLGKPGHNPGSVIGGLIGFGIYWFCVWWYLHNINLVWMG